jgi:replication fork clamp-binding protein CrfC
MYNKSYKIVENRDNNYYNYNDINKINEILFLKILLYNKLVNKYNKYYFIKINLLLFISFFYLIMIKVIYYGYN